MLTTGEETQAAVNEVYSKKAFKVRSTVLPVRIRRVRQFQISMITLPREPSEGSNRL